MDIKLEHIQANIIKSNGRQHNRFIFFQFLDDADQTLLRKAIYKLYFGKELDFPVINSAKGQVEGSKAFNNRKDEKLHKFQNSIVIGLHFNAQGLDLIGASNWPTHDNYFKYGMADSGYGGRLQDPPVEKWESCYKSKKHMLVSIASNSIESLDHFESKAREFFKDLTIKIFVENGTKLQWGKDAIEPFGFRDNISNPTFFYKVKRGSKYYYRRIKERFKIALDARGGSFLVFRKLEQDVVRFHEKIKMISEQLEITIAYAEAQLVGRFKDGTPLAISSEPGLKGKSDKEIEAIGYFDLEELGYENDENGYKCPIHAHIRKTNPRNQRDWIFNTGYNNANIDKDIFGVIVRRGIPYEEIGKSVGLLFLCYQQSIENQFVVIQQHWSNHEAVKLVHPLKGEISIPTGLDPISGQTKESFIQKDHYNVWNKKWGEASGKKLEMTFNDLVTFKGGEFFYAPSVKDLQSLYLKTVD